MSAASDVLYGRQAGRIVRSRGADVPVYGYTVCAGPVIVGAPRRIHGACCDHPHTEPGASCRGCGMTRGR